MSRALELVLLRDFRRLIKIYIESFPHSYARFNRGPTDFDRDLVLYRNSIANNAEAIIRAAAKGIGDYAALYGVRAGQSFDEFKTIYFLGRAIESRLIASNYVRISQVHMFTMIGLLDARLVSLGIRKSKLTRAMTELVRVQRFDSELGIDGCYLVYKCVATTPRDYTPAGDGLDG